MEFVQRPASFPAHSRPLDMDNPRKRDLVSIGLESIGLMENPRSRRVVYALIVAVAFLVPSPWEMYRVFSEVFLSQQTAQSE
ncbi:hypothetical protein 23F_00065 [Ralstonia phage Gerry]|uniref:Transmembrane protein n=1 Tax=Ralstonia phage Gerry TaxID=2759727 RepID=A0A7G5BAA2_9CAUD|nr:hypothetical protein KMC47_gp58 [Ralstonia phage Gerry]QMV33225.1 hypothetical protein 23F_00065 [Ralstonia phage Gerry]